MNSSPAKVLGIGSSAASKGKEISSSNPQTTAAFAPSPSYTPPAAKQRSTILVHRKSPLLIATPPSITRALAFSHPFILPLNKLIGLVSWTSGDPWESFLLVAGFWALVLYGDDIMRWAGPVVVVVGMMLGMYSRRYSPLSSTGWTGEKQNGNAKNAAESKMKHQKSLDEIVDTLSMFTSRCNVLVEPLLELTDFLSTQMTATSASTRPALTTLLVRITIVTPLWILMTLPPLRIITTRRVVLAAGTLILTWHSRPARVSRIILWRSRLIRRISSAVTGLSFSGDRSTQPSPKGANPPLPPRRTQHAKANSIASNAHAEPSGVRFTFVAFENQRRWLGLGWTHSLLAYERAAWTDEQLNPSDSTENFKLPEVENGPAHWRWVPGSEWQVEGAGKGKTSDNTNGWIYYDTKVFTTACGAKKKMLTCFCQWNDGRRGQDGWGRYTRRRKWYRDAELVELPLGSEMDSPPNLVKSASRPGSSEVSMNDNQSIRDSDDASINSPARMRGFRRRGSRTSGQSSGYSNTIGGGEEDANLHRHMPLHQQDGDWSVGDEVRMGLG